MVGYNPRLEAFETIGVGATRKLAEKIKRIFENESETDGQIQEHELVEA